MTVLRISAICPTDIKELVLIMDGSQARRGCMVLMIGVVYKKRALPIAWLVYKGKKGHTTTKRHIEALEKVKSPTSRGSKGGFGGGCRVRYG